MIQVLLFWIVFNWPYVHLNAITTYVNLQYGNFTEKVDLLKMVKWREMIFNFLSGRLWKRIQRGFCWYATKKIEPKLAGPAHFEI